MSCPVPFQLSLDFLTTLKCKQLYIIQEIMDAWKYANFDISLPKDGIIQMSSELLKLL